MIKRIIFSLLLAGEIAVIADMVFAFFRNTLSVTAFFLIFAIVAATGLLCKKISLKFIKRTFFTLMAAAVLAVGAVFAQLALYSAATAYEETDSSKAELFSNKEVMIFAPHQDDELSMLSGTLAEYIRYGSNVRIVYVTNGDYMGLAEKRFSEARNVAEFLGIPQENVIFLGYGDGWEIEGNIHIYNAPENEAVSSTIGRTETYGPVWAPGKAYTRQNMYEDIRDVIDIYKPDVIYSMAFEPHGDHRATAFFVEEALGEILGRGEGYEPLVLESASYHTSYYGAEDFYNQNILSIPNPFESEYNADMHIYSWAERVRLPVAAGTLSRSLLGSDVYKALSLHETQGCNLRAESIVSGDTVFWQRDTGSLSYTADIKVSSGDGEKLNNFKLLDSSNINSEQKPFEDLWLPDDAEKLATVSFDSPVDISEIRLYDNPSFEDNVLNAKISFDDGSSFETGPLRENGGASSIAVDKKNISSFTVQLIKTEGELAGLTEIEVYEVQKDYGLNFVKIQNQNGDFVYDYYINRDGVEYFELYTAGNAPADTGEYTLSYSTKSNCFADYEDGKILVSCPVGQSITVTVSSPDGKYTDTVLISNPGIYHRSIGWQIEKYVKDSFFFHLRLNNCFNFAREAYRLIRY